MRNLYYCFGIYNKEDRYKFITFFSKFPDIIPIFMLSKEGDRLYLCILFDGDVDKIVWKKFKDPAFKKYYTAKFYRLKKEFDKKSVRGWKIIERQKGYITISYKTKTVYTVHLEKEELESFKDLVFGNLTSNILYRKEETTRVLIL